MEEKHSGQSLAFVCSTQQISSSGASFSRISHSSSDISGDSLSGTWELSSMWRGLMDSLLPRIWSISLKCFGMISPLSSLSLSDGTSPPLPYPVDRSLSLVFLYFFVKFANLFLHCCGVLSLSTFCSLHCEWSWRAIDSHSGELKALYCSLSSFSLNSSTKIFSSVSVQRFFFFFLDQCCYFCCGCSLAIASQADQNGVILKMSGFLALLAIESHRTAAQHIEVAGSKGNTSCSFANIVAVDLAWKKKKRKTNK